MFGGIAAQLDAAFKPHPRSVLTHPTVLMTTGFWSPRGFCKDPQPGVCLGMLLGWEAMEPGGGWLF